MAKIRPIWSPCPCIDTTLTFVLTLPNASGQKQKDLLESSSEQNGIRTKNPFELKVLTESFRTKQFQQKKFEQKTKTGKKREIPVNMYVRKEFT
jgi:hypothetical protein